ncbi:autoinducer binding domain-containing protein [Roseovarius salinarum]|uniref:autoinducer binding domain-containing protein n=1 Tax=Roseovarius salinarum TaxID=1981892 RepID=UPI000C33F201|nr:autoinducer binding domain-containing protein [Roseovarius salinarum]
MQSLELIDLGSTREGEERFVRYLSGVCEALELDYASYAAANPVSGKVHAFTTYPDAWKRHYIEQGLHRVDPTLDAPRRSIAPVDWARLDPDRRFAHVFGQARDFGLPDTGLTIPVRGPYGETALFSVTRQLRRDGWQKLKRHVLGDLQTAAIHLHDTVMSTENLLQALRRPQLSGREVEILQWVAEGKSQQDIGDILAISHRTVEVHLRSAREKLCTLTTAQAIGRAVSLGLVRPG